jgi:pimeloyl-ACP methyl ester carboxylesterase
MTMPPEPTDFYYDSQGLRLHVTDWGNEAAAPLILLHGGRDHSRSWDTIARALQPHFHVIAPDLRGHGDSEWAKGSSYSFSDNVYDLARLVGTGREVALVGHSFGGMIAQAFAGTFPERVSRLAVLDGAFLPAAPSASIDKRMAQWMSQLDRISTSQARRFHTLAEAAERMSAHNPRLTPEQALHLARHAVRQNTDGTYSWKYDPSQSVRAPYRLSADDYGGLLLRIACPTLLLYASEGFIPDPDKAGILRYFKQADQKIIAGAGHWLHHDAPEEVLAALRAFLGAPGTE